MILDVKKYLQAVSDVYAEEAINGLDFWEEHGMDWEKGGLVTYLDREGNWYLDEKQGWFTGRAMFSFARAYNDICKKQRWLDAAENIYDFMVAHQFVPGGNGKMYHNMNRDGVPVDGDPRCGGNEPALRITLHDESFAIMGLAELYRATGRQDVKDTLYRVFEAQQFIFKNPDYYKDGTMSRPEEQPVAPLGILMSLICSAQTARAADPERKDLYTAKIAVYVDQVLTHYYIPERKLITEGEIDAPGHGMELAWFILAEGLYTGNQKLVELCADAVQTLFEIGWDTRCGGFKLLANFDGKPAFHVGGDLKYWWPTNELLNGLLYAYVGTGRQWFLETFRMVQEWAMAHFPDREKGEWFGYLNYDGTLLSPCKGDCRKGPFHLYRSIFAIRDLIDAYLKQNEKTSPV